MKKYICLFTIVVLTSCISYSQIKFIENKKYTKEFLKKSLDDLIKNAKYIFDASLIQFSDIYYIKDEDQTYYRSFVKVNFVYKGRGIQKGDTVLYVWKQSGRGEGVFVTDHDNRPRIFPNIAGDPKESCLLLEESKYPRKANDKWADKKQLAFIKTEIGYFGGNYNIRTENPPIAISFRGIEFMKRIDWYNYLKQFPGIKVPKTD